MSKLRLIHNNTSEAIKMFQQEFGNNVSRQKWFNIQQRAIDILENSVGLPGMWNEKQHIEEIWMQVRHNGQILE